MDRKEFELLVRTNLGSSKQQLAGLADSVGKIEQAVVSQTAAAKNGEASIDELKASLLALGNLETSLGSKAEMLGQFTRLSDSMEKSEGRVAKTSAKLEEFKTKLQGSAEVTDKQQAKLVQLTKAHDNAVVALTRQQTTQQLLTLALKDAGIETTNFAQAENTLRTSAAQLGVVMANARAAVASYATDVRAARDAEKSLAENKAFDAKLSDAQKLGKSADYALFWQNALEQAEVAEKRLAADASLRKIADDAVAATKQYETLANAAADLSPRVITLKEAIAAIVNPSAEARSTLAGVEAQVKTLSDTVSTIKGPVKDYQQTMQDLAATQKSIATQAGLIDTFNRQVTAVRAARTEFSEARDQVNQYAAAVRAGGDSGAKFTGALADAQNRAKQAATALRDVLAAANGSKQALTEAGISTNNLSQAEERLLNAARTSTAATNQLSAAVKEYGVATDRVRKGGGIFGADEGRTTLSMTQRLRGELLALGATYVGLQGNINLAKSALDAFNVRSSAKLTLGAGLETNDKAKIDAEYNYVKAQSDRIGIELEKSLGFFAKFAIAAAKTGRSRQEIHYIFEAFAEGGQVLGLSQDKMEGVFVALEQFFSKGQIMTEELKKQMGNALPGAFEVAQKKWTELQKKLGVPNPDFMKAIKEGQIGLGFVVELAEEWRKIVADQLPDAVKRLQAEQNRFNNSIFDFKLAIADSGFADEWRKALVEMQVFFKSDSGTQLAKSLSDKFSTVAKVIAALLKNMDTLISVTTTLIALWATKFVVTMANDLLLLSTNAGKAEVAITKLQKAFFLVQAFIIGWEIGTILYEKFDIVPKIVEFFLDAWSSIKHSFAAAFESMGAIAFNVFGSILNTVNEMAKKVVGIFAKIARAGGLDGVAKTLEDSINNATKLESISVDAIIAKRRAALLKDMADNKAFVAELLLLPAPREGKTAPPPEATDKPDPNPNDKKKGLTEAEISKREHLLEKFRGELDAIDARIDKADKGLLEPQLAAIDAQFAKMKRELTSKEARKLIGAEAPGFLNELTELTFQSKQQVMRKFNDELAASKEQLDKKLEAADAAAGRKDKESLDARLRAVTDSYAATYREIADYRQRLLKNGINPEPADRMKEHLDQGVKEIQQLEAKKFYGEQLKRQEQDLNDALHEREAKLKTIADNEEAGAISTAEANVQRKAAIEEMQPKLEALAETAKTFIAAMNGKISQADLDAFIAKINLAVASGGKLNKTFELTAKQVNEQLATGLTGVFDKLIQNIQAAVAGTKSWGAAFKGAAVAFLQFAADFLRQIALMIIKALILKALETQFPGIGTFVSTVANTAVKNHEGGVVGNSNARTTSVPSVYFMNAPRYHAGGLPGLAPNEVATILKRNEEVLTENDPRNVINGGGASGGSRKGNAGGVRFVLVDDRSRVHEAMSGAEGDKVIVQSIRRNSATIKQFMNR